MDKIDELFSDNGNLSGFGELKYGSKGSEVIELQRKLIEISVKHNRPDFNIPSGATGNFLSQTLEAVKNFQKAVGLPPTGVVDDLTMSAIDSVYNSEAGTVAWQTQPAQPQIRRPLPVKQPDIIPSSVKPIQAGIFGLDWFTIFVIIIGAGLVYYLFIAEKR
ncbi:MAG: peptidoglycan-binding domain-containing protein [Thermoplasmata archaeon]